MTTTSMRNLRSNSRTTHSTSKQSISFANEIAPSSKETPSCKMETSIVSATNEKEIAKRGSSDDADTDVEGKHEEPAESTDLLASIAALPLNQKYTMKNIKQSEKAVMGNELTHLIPGYTAPMRLESNLTIHTSGSGIASHATSLSKLRQRASLAEVARYNPPTTITRQLSTTITSFLSNGVKKSTTTTAPAATTSFLASSSYRKTHSKIHDHTAGSGWFHMNPTPMTNQLKTDLSLIRNRNYLDPKKFYKSADSFDGKILQVGTVIEGSTEYYSSRMTRKERRGNITEELMADANVRQYAKRKYLDMQMEKERSSSGSKKKGGGGKQKYGRKGGRR